MFGVGCVINMFGIGSTVLIEKTINISALTHFSHSLQWLYHRFKILCRLSM